MKYLPLVLANLRRHKLRTVLTMCSVALALFLRTDLGMAMRASGNNPRMARSVGIDVDRMVVAGLALSNGLVALINLAAAAWAVQRVRHLMKLLSLPATRQHLMMGTGSSSRPAGVQRSPDEQRAVHEHPAAAA